MPDRRYHTSATHAAEPLCHRTLSGAVPLNRYEKSDNVNLRYQNTATGGTKSPILSTITAAEVVYALTNDKGRTRSERAGEHYYAGIRDTPYAPFVKLCDRLANMTYSFNGTNDANNHMHKVYASEWSHFIQAITVCNQDSRYSLPASMVTEVQSLFA